MTRQTVRQPAVKFPKLRKKMRKAAANRHAAALHSKHRQHK